MRYRRKRIRAAGCGLERVFPALSMDSEQRFSLSVERLERVVAGEMPS
jgi:hypothetical protein